MIDAEVSIVWLNVRTGGDDLSKELSVMTGQRRDRAKWKVGD